jgi:hypothetical protein
MISARGRIRTKKGKPPMDLPKGKNRPKLPPKPRGGGAAARQEQFAQERGLKDGRPLNDADTNEQTDEFEKSEDREDQA